MQDKGEDFVRRLGQQKIRIFQVSARAVANFVVSGEVPLSPALFNSHIANSRARLARSKAWRNRRRSALACGIALRKQKTEVGL